MKILLCLLLAAGFGAEEEEEAWDPALTDETRSYFFARAMVSMGDLDGDGAGDFLVSSPRETPHEGEPDWDLIYGRKPTADGHPPKYGVVRAISGQKGRVLFAHSEPGGFGETLACMGDVNGDGLNDFAVGLSGSRGLDGYYVCSGEDGSVLFSNVEETGSMWRSCSIASVPDTTGDGVRELVVGGPDRFAFNGEERPPSHVSLVSGSDGRVLMRIDSSRFDADRKGPQTHTIGRQVWGMPDLDGDGKGEFAFSILHGLEFDSPGRVLVVKGSDGEVLHEVYPPRRWGKEGVLSLAMIGDLDQDGLPEWVVGNSAKAFYFYDEEDFGPDGVPESWHQPRGAAGVYSGLSGERTFRLSTDQRTPRFGHALAGGGDFNADGVPDVIVTDYGGDFKGGCYVYSGADGSLIRQHEGEVFWDYGASLIVVDDLDGDDCADYVVGCMNDYPGSGGTGFAIVYSGRTGEVRYFLGGWYRL